MTVSLENERHKRIRGKEVATLCVPGAGIAGYRANRLRKYNFISNLRLANGNTGKRLC